MTPSTGHSPLEMEVRSLRAELELLRADRIDKGIAPGADRPLPGKPGLGPDGVRQLAVRAVNHCLRPGYSAGQPGRAGDA